MNNLNPFSIILIMGVVNYISLIPLPVCLLPNEREILNIDEERYRDLIDSLLVHRENFGIPCNNLLNTVNIGSLVQLEKVSPILGTDQISIQVYCTQLFELTKFYYRHFKGSWPGGEIRAFDSSLFTKHYSEGILKGSSPFKIASEINLSLDDKLRLLKFKDSTTIEAFLVSKKKSYDFCVDQELAVKDDLYLN